MSTAHLAAPLPKSFGRVSVWAGAATLVVVLWWLLIAGQINLLCGFAIALLLLLMIAARQQEAAVICSLAYLILLGDIRRILAQVATPSAFDPLLLVVPVVTMVFALPRLLQGRVREPLSKAVLALLIIMALEVLNPLQGGLSIGLSGVFFYIVPVLWFWIGRDLGGPSVLRKLIYLVLLPLGCCAAILGICQSFIGFLPYQQKWIDQVGRTYQSLYVGSSVRAFGFSTSAAEYATLLELSLIAAVAAFFAGRRLWALAVPMLATALLLSGGRGLTIKVVIALSVLWVIRRGKRLSPTKIAGMAVLGGLCLFGVSLVAGRFAPSTEGSQRSNSAVQDALGHQMGGLAHPFDEKYSSAGLHSNMVTTGFMKGFTSPFGHGLGATTFAAQKFGADSDEASSEFDFSDMFIALGLLGGLIYLAVAVFGVGAAFKYMSRTRLEIGLPVLAILIASLGGWLIEGQYSTCSIVFFLLGSLIYRGSDRAALP